MDIVLLALTLGPHSPRFSRSSKPVPSPVGSRLVVRKDYLLFSESHREILPLYQNVAQEPPDLVPEYGRDLVGAFCSALRIRVWSPKMVRSTKTPDSSSRPHGHDSH